MTFSFTEQFQTLNATDDCEHTSINFIPSYQFVVQANPNPFHNEFSLTIQKQNFKQLSIAIQNIFGQTVFREQEFNPAKTIDMTEQPNGIYFLVLTIDGQQTTRKITKQ